MKVLIKYTCLLILALFVFSNCKRQEESPALKGPYLGQNLPGDIPELFAPGIVSTGMYERDLAITRDGKEIYYGLAFSGNVTIMVTRQVDGKWSEPEIAYFASDLSYFYFEPALHPDGNKIFFLCSRPPEGQEPKPGWGHQNIWVADRQENGNWGEPYDLGAPVNSENNEFFPSLANNGTLYFTRSMAEDNLPNIYRSKFVDGKYTEPEILPESVNGNGNLYNACISPDESYLIACVDGREDDNTPETIDYCIYFRKSDETWSTAIDMGEIINSSGINAISPYISPDGNYFFFASILNNMDSIFNSDRIVLNQIKTYSSSPQNGSSDIYWINTTTIQKLKTGL